MAQSRHEFAMKSGLVVEGNGWAVLRRPMPDLNDQAARTLLNRGAKLPDAFRYVRDGQSSRGGVLLLGETCQAEDGVPFDERAIERWLGRIEGGDSPGDSPAEDAIEDILNESGLGFSHRESCWAAPVPGGLPGELVVHRVGDGVRVETVLAAWEELSRESSEALAEFLLAAQAGLRFARCELDFHSAKVVARVRTEDLDRQLIHGLRGVAAAARLLSREATALLVPEVAPIYLELMTRPVG